MQGRLLSLIFFLLCPLVLQAAPGDIDRQLKQLDHLIRTSALDQADSFVQVLAARHLSEYNSTAQTRLRFELAYEEAKIKHHRGNEQEALRTLLPLIENTEEQGFFGVAAKSLLLTCIIFEITDDLPACKKALDRTLKLIKKYSISELYSTYCVRIASYYRFVGAKDSTVYYARAALLFGQEYDQKPDIADASLLLGMSLPFAQYKEAIAYHQQADQTLRSLGDYHYTPVMYANVADIYLRHGLYRQALANNDSAFRYSHEGPASRVFRQRYNLYLKLGNKDSALAALTEYVKRAEIESDQRQALEIEKIRAAFQEEKQQAVIQNKNYWLSIALGLSTILLLALLFILFQYRSIRRQNTVIKSQVTTLSKYLEQKEVLLAELQHRVKNNLMHVISLLEIQKESIGHNNMEELIRENQNRIQSMALLHGKLLRADRLNEIAFDAYLQELCALVLDSYKNQATTIKLDISSALGNITIALGMPLGQIVVELLSNSLKHAFCNRDAGSIAVMAHYDEECQQGVLCFQDDGPGFDFENVQSKGLGLQIIKGLASQIDAELLTDRSAASGFHISLHFQQQV